MVDAAFQFPLRHATQVAVIPGGQSVDETHSNLQAAQAEIPKALWTDLQSQGLLSEKAPL